MQRDGPTPSRSCRHPSAQRISRQAQYEPLAAVSAQQPPTAPILSSQVFVSLRGLGVPEHIPPVPPFLKAEALHRGYS